MADSEWGVPSWGDATWGGDPPPNTAAVVGSWLVLPEGGRPTGPAGEGAGTRYPFVDPEAALKGILSDFWLSYPPPATRPLFLSWMHGFDLAVNGGTVVAGDSEGGDPHPTHPVDLVVVDADSRVIFDSTAATASFWVMASAATVAARSSA